MSNGDLSRFIGTWLPQIEEEMRTVLAIDDDAVAPHYGMMRYHLGWVDQNFHANPAPTGKRLRPILCLMAASEVGGDLVSALPAAAAIEILHNFSLIHDDVEDADEMRRHRPTVWKVWGVSQAINVGDGMFALAFDAMHRLTRRGVAATTVLAALERFIQTCLALTEGQHLDLSFESRTLVSIDEYMRMIQGKTAALVGAAVSIGALVGGATINQQTDLMQFGQAIGLAFQIQDDILGIWGDPQLTGKAAGNDILRRKKSLPLVHALNHPTAGPPLQQYFANPIREEQLPSIRELLDQAETRSFSEEGMRRQHDLAYSALSAALGADRAEHSPLWNLAESLLTRNA